MGADLAALDIRVTSPHVCLAPCYDLMLQVLYVRPLCLAECLGIPHLSEGRFEVRSRPLTSLPTRSQQTNVNPSRSQYRTFHCILTNPTRSLGHILEVLRFILYAGMVCSPGL